ncbi:hypothetical protein VTI28DRAFT_4109 [Corynascus sepedonium]
MPLARNIASGHSRLVGRYLSVYVDDRCLDRRRHISGVKNDQGYRPEFHITQNEHGLVVTVASTSAVSERSSLPPLLRRGGCSGPFCIAAMQRSMCFVVVETLATPKI